MFIFYSLKTYDENKCFICFKYVLILLPLKISHHIYFVEESNGHNNDLPQLTVQVIWNSGFTCACAGRRTHNCTQPYETVFLYDIIMKQNFYFLDNLNYYSASRCIYCKMEEHLKLNIGSIFDTKIFCLHCGPLQLRSGKKKRRKKAIQKHLKISSFRKIKGHFLLL